jgi:thioredoxin 1
MSVVFEITDAKKMDEVMRSSYKLVIIDIYADWCGPCKHLAPKMEELARIYASPDILFCKLDVANVKVDVKGLPTIEFWMLGQNGRQMVRNVLGADIKEIRNVLVQLAGQPPQTSAHVEAEVREPGVPKNKSGSDTRQYRTYGSYS